jgi:hypothetical protein
MGILPPSRIRPSSGPPVAISVKRLFQPARLATFVFQRGDSIQHGAAKEKQSPIYNTAKRYLF